MKFCIAALMFLFAASFTTAQTQPEYSSSEILLRLQKLNTIGSVLYVAAHPDDENTRLLAYLANEKKFRTGYLSLTRGDGGQNLIGKEQGELLGLIRTNELLKARSVDGAEQFFTRANDFGFSKNPEETFSIWNRDSILADVVWTIRKFRPDVIICRFPTTGEGGHGHHTASAMLAEEAFDAAADPKRFPEQLQYVSTWQPKRLFWNTFNFGTTNTTSEDQLKIDVGVYNALLGEYYGEIAADSRSMHKSQGFGSAKTRGSAIEYLKQLKGDVVKSDPFENIDTGWTRLKPFAKAARAISECVAAYDPANPQKSAAKLAEIHRVLSAVDSNDPEVRYWKSQKLGETEDLLIACAGFWAEAYSASFSGTPGKPVDLTVNALSKSGADVRIESMSFIGEDSTLNLQMAANRFYTFRHTMNLPRETAFSNPYWLRETHPVEMYTVKDQLLRGIPENIPAVNVVYRITVAGIPLKVVRPVVYKFVDPVKGEIYRPFEVLPPATVNISEGVLVFADDQPKTIQLRIAANETNLEGTVEVKAPEGWKVTIAKPAVKLKERGDETVVEVILSATPKARSGSFEARVVTPDGICDKSIERLSYDHIPYQFTLRDAEAKLVFVDVKKSGTNIAYIPGAGDDVVACLKQIGYNVTVLTDELLENTPLAQFDAILTGIRAYNINPKLQAYYPQLMDYVKNGGNLVVQYNTNSRVGPVSGKIGPYAYTTSRNRVTNEKAEVRFTDPGHVVLNAPNRISAADFDGWVQERGIYHATDLDPQYETMLSMNDPNEKPDEGSLIVGKYGKGNFVYTGLVFFRELPAGVPGAYRLLANVLSLPENNVK